MTIASQPLITFGQAFLLAAGLAGAAWSQGGPAQGPTGEPKGVPSIVVPSTAPSIGVPSIAGPRQERPPVVSRATKTPPARYRDLVPSCQRLPAGNFRRFATMEGSLREEKNSQFVFTGACFGTAAPLSGIVVVIARGDTPAKPFFKPLGRFGVGDMAVQSWSPTRIVVTVPVLLDPASVPLAPTDVLAFIMNTPAGTFRSILTKDDVDKLERDGILTFPPSP